MKRILESFLVRSTAFSCAALSPYGACATNPLAALWRSIAAVLRPREENMKAWLHWLALSLAVIGTLSACGGGEITQNTEVNNYTDIAEQAPPPLPHGPMTLAQAIDSGVATVVATGQDLETIKLRVTATQPVQLTIPVGTLLASGDVGTQNMMTAESKELSLEGTPEAPATEEVTIAAYCVNFHRAIPSESSSFSVTQASGETRPLKALAECLVGQRAEHRAKQVAMWAISDRFAFRTAEQNVADSLAQARSQHPEISAAGMAEAESVYRRFFEETRVSGGPLLERCGYTLANLPLFA
jgi:hypothetical protein